MAVICKLERITPDKAKNELAYNTGNFRPIDKSRIRNLVREMTTGNWDVNGETIKFSDSGEMLDGQHRLTACVVSGVTINSLVVRGLSCSAYHVDRGKPRTVGQWLRHNNVKNGAAIAAITRSAIIHNKGLWSKVGVGIDGVTDSESLAFAEKYTNELQEACRGPRVQGIPSSVLSTILLLGSPEYDVRNNEYATWFQAGLATGQEIKECDAVFHLRNRLLQQQGAKRITPFMVKMLATLAWNKTVEGVECTAAGLRLRITGPNPSPLPNEVHTAGE